MPMAHINHLGWRICKSKQMILGIWQGSLWISNSSFDMDGQTTALKDLEFLTKFQSEALEFRREQVKEVIKSCNILQDNTTTVS